MTHPANRPDLTPVQGSTVGRWLLLGTGAAITAGTVVLVVVMVSGLAPTWLWSMLAVSIWGPVALVAWVFLERRRRLVRRLTEVGVRARATIVRIGQTSSEIGARPVLLLTVAVTASGVMPFETVVRTAPPAHLLSALRPGVVLPAVLDPDRPTRLLLDWALAEREI